MQQRAFCTLGLALIAACGGDGAGPRDGLPEELVGVWQAAPACAPACRFTFTNVADAQEVVNFTSFGAISRLTLNASGSFVFNAGVPLATPVAGRMHVEGNDLVVEASGEFPEERIGYRLQGGHLHLEWEETFAFDLDEDGLAEDVRVNGVFEPVPTLQ